MMVVEAYTTNVSHFNYIMTQETVFRVTGRHNVNIDNIYLSSITTHHKYKGRGSLYTTNVSHFNYIMTQYTIFQVSGRDHVNIGNSFLSTIPVRHKYMTV